MVSASTSDTSAQEAFCLLPLRLELISESLSLDEPAGALWHSGLGLALKRSFPTIFDLLFAETGRDARLYGLRPSSSRIQPGQPFTLGINLYGRATRHAPAICQAVAALGSTGLGERRQTFRFQSAAAAVDDATPFLAPGQGLLRWPAPVTADHWLRTRTIHASRATVRFRTPVAVKADNQIQREPLSCELLVRRLLGRLAQLTDSSGQRHP